MIRIFIYLLIAFLLASFISACATTEDLVPETLPDKDSAGEIEADPNGESIDTPGAQAPEAEDVENRFILKEAFPGVSFIRPLDIQNSKDGSGRLFVVEQAGMIYVLAGPNTTEKELFLDIRDQVDDSGNEMGLLGLAFHPDFAENGYFFVNYTNSEGTVVSRLKASGNQVDPTGSETILTFRQPYSNHNGGQLAFGPDGYLYISTGDGGSGGDPQGHGQNRQSFHGNILRIDIDNQGPQGNYAIPPDNPFVGNSEGYLEEIYAYGLRNPWRFSFDPATEKLWAADVGQGAVEEINIIEKGNNYGWNVMEGSQCFNPPTNCDSTGLEMPVYEYLHPVGRSITGGFAYRGTELPFLKGAYIYADYVTGLIWALWYQEGEETVNYILADTNLNITSFGIDEDNELYLTAFDGRVYQLALD